MLYQFKGRLCGLVCAECPEALSNVYVRLYRHHSAQDITALAVAHPKDTFGILLDQEIKNKATALIAETKTDANGNFVFDLDQKQNYLGEAFEIDVYCPTVPNRKPGRKIPPPLQFSITTLRPLWRETAQGFVASWDYCIPTRYWCAVRARFGAWAICGKVTTCDDKKIPIPGLKVTAFDVDWTQDDELGSGWTDISGRFRIDYLAEDFQKTPFSPLINLEWFGGPDIYFNIKTAGGIDVLKEPPSRGRQADRENQSNCFCIELCIKDLPPALDVPPSFTHVGQINIVTGINPISGLSNAGNRAFYSAMRLHGTIPKTLNGSQTEYMFDVAEYDPITNLLGGVSKVLPAQIGRTVIGQRMLLTGDPVNPLQVDDWTVNGNPGELIAPFSADGWVQVPQDAHFYPNTGSLPGLIVLNSPSLPGWGSKNVGAHQAGSTTIPPPLAQNRYFQLRMWVRSSTTPAQIAGTCVRIAINNTLYDDVSKGGSWAPQMVSGQLGVGMLNIQELVGNGCGGISNSLHALYTAAHPNLGTASISMNGPGGPYSFVLSDAVGASLQNRFGSATLSFPVPPFPPGYTVSNLLPCAYIVTLSVQVLLTTGDAVPDHIYDQIGFCKRG